jgi:hypothetical protein
MLDELAADLERDGVSLLLARDVGQVQDVLGRVDPEQTSAAVYPTVREAVAAARALS